MFQSHLVQAQVTITPRITLLLGVRSCLCYLI